MLSIAFFVGVELMQWTAALAPLLASTGDRNEMNGAFSTLLGSVFPVKYGALWLYQKTL